MLRLETCGLNDDSKKAMLGDEGMEYNEIRSKGIRD